MGKGSKARKRQNKPQRAAVAPHPVGETPPAPDRALRPTSQRRARGVWALPQGPVRSAQPMVDTASDMIGQLHHARRITGAQEQAARQFQVARFAYMQELPDVAQYKSCLAGSVLGYDDGEGDPAVIAEYRRLEKLLGEYRSEVVWVCEDQQPPRNIAALQSGLDAIAGVKRKSA